MRSINTLIRVMLLSEALIYASTEGSKEENSPSITSQQQDTSGGEEENEERRGSGGGEEAPVTAQPQGASGGEEEADGGRVVVEYCSTRTQNESGETVETRCGCAGDCDNCCPEGMISCLHSLGLL
ncbi:ECU02_0785 [Encephalitozoon cuniculi GB-M1]|uniref:ECU02_0785 protein n=1 Tax=Encephalitozoon cuniculi (strain GB-M1) TaxID=284813 RepID=I7L8G7_ENCCU|nr:uncharacterized protein ECU02_0785 [Encephalitozoon cuniculi GB-M1]CCI73912.1 ECU02_0785 [Encephalitozoon cuniculi GB-M1]